MTVPGRARRGQPRDPQHKECGHRLVQKREAERAGQHLQLLDLYRKGERQGA